MRGRTNILGGGGGAVVNGQIKDFIVADGNNISVGDFVTMISGPASYYETPSNINIEQYYKVVFKISDSKCAIFYDKNIMILDLSNGIVLDKIISGNFQSVSSGNIYQIDNTHFAILYGGSTSNSIYSFKADILTLDVENNECSFVTKTCSVDVSSLSYVNFNINGDVAYVFNGVLFIQTMYSKYSSGSYIYEYAIAWFDLNSDKSDLYKFEDPGNYMPYSNNPSEFCWSHDENDNIYIFYQNSSSSSSLIEVNKLSLSLENESLQVIGKYQMNTGHIHKYNFRNLLSYIGNNNFALSCNNGIEIIKVDNGITLLNYIQDVNNMFDIPSISVYGNYLLIFQIDSARKIGYQGVISLDDLLTIEDFQTQNFTIGVLSGSSKGYVNSYFDLLSFDNKFLLFGVSPSSSKIVRVIECKLENENIVGMDSENYVTSYNGKALGFAKTGGNAGDTIKVYVPYDNN